VQRRKGHALLVLRAGVVLLGLACVATACAPRSQPERARDGAREGSPRDNASTKPSSTASNARSDDSAAGAAGVLGSTQRAIDPTFTRQSWTLANEDGPAGEGWVLSSESYRIYTTASSRLADRLPPFLERALAHYTSALLPLPMPSKPMETYFLGTRGQWERVTQRLMGSDAGIYLRIDRGGYSARGRSVFYDIGPRDTFVIAAHESWHQYTQTVFAESLPLALEEGVATYMEGYRWTGPERTEAEFLPWRNFERFGQLRDCVASDRVLPLDQLLTTSPQDLLAEQGSEAALRYYAQVWALIHFLVEGEGGKYKPALLSMVSDAKEGTLSARVGSALGERAARSVRFGRRGVDVLGVYVGSPSSELNDAYQRFVRAIVQPGAGQKVSVGKSPLAP
jgi:hypothetical protein